MPDRQELSDDAIRELWLAHKGMGGGNDDWLQTIPTKEMLAFARALIAAERERMVKVMREEFTRCLNLTYDQRAYSWHEIQDTLTTCAAAIRQQVKG